jgi:hypothetical protein
MSEDNELSTEERAEQDYQRKAKTHQIIDEALGGDGWHAESGSNEALGQNILREEIGYFGPWEGPKYSLDQETRDRLLAHGRQDVASTFAMAKSAFKEAHQARRVSVRTTLLVYVSLLLNVMILATLWLR